MADTVSALPDVLGLLLFLCPWVPSELSLSTENFWVLEWERYPVQMRSAIEEQSLGKALTITIAIAITITITTN